MALIDIPQDTTNESAARVVGPRLTGVWQKIAIAAWAVLFLLSLLSFIFSITNLNLWDRIPAAELTRYFPLFNQQIIDSRNEFQSEVTQIGFTLAAFANLLTAFRIIGSLPLFILSVLLVRRYPGHLMGVLFAILLAVMGAAGMWNDTLFGWATLRASWIQAPGQLLNSLLWFGLIFLYTFPDGRFMPRWTFWLVILLIPIVISLIFDLPIFLNPATWPSPLYLLPNLIFIGVAFYSVLYRYHKADLALKAQLRGFVVGLPLLMVVYFILYFMNDVYSAATGQSVFSSIREVLIYILISAPLWYGLELVFAIGTGRSIFHDRLLEG